MIFIGEPLKKYNVFHPHPGEPRVIRFDANGRYETHSRITAKRLLRKGFKTIEDIVSASIGDLTKIKGIGDKKAEKIIEQAQKSKK